MSNGRDLDELVEDLQRRRVQVCGPPCLSDAVLEALADGALRPDEIASARDHLTQCLACLRAYAELRSLLEVSRAEEPPGSTSPAGAGRWARVAAGVRRALTFRLPLPVTVAVAAASVVLTWAVMAGTERGRSQLPLSRAPVPATELANEGSRSVAGTVEEVRDASSAGVTAHVIKLRDATGASYAIVVWGAPVVRAGDAVTAQGVFSPVDDTGGGVLFKGVASDVRRHASR